MTPSLTTESLTRARVWLYHVSRTAATSGSRAKFSSGSKSTFRCVAYGNSAGEGRSGVGIGAIVCVVPAESPRAARAGRRARALVLVEHRAHVPELFRGRVHGQHTRRVNGGIRDAVRGELE